MEDKWEGIPLLLKERILNREMTKNQKLFMFLEEYNIYNIFYINMYNDKSRTEPFEDCLYAIERKQDLLYIIDAAFIWAKTPEGFTFWSCLQDKAYEKYERKN